MSSVLSSKSFDDGCLRERVVNDNPNAIFTTARNKFRFHLTRDGVVHPNAFACHKVYEWIWEKERHNHSRLVNFRLNPSISLTDADHLGDLPRSEVAQSKDLAVSVSE